MGNEIHNFKEKVNAIPIPEEKMNAAISNTISSNNRSPKKFTYILAVAATLMVILFGSAFVSPAMAKLLIQVPLFGGVLSYFDIGLEEVSNKGLVTKVGETFVDQEIPVTITEVYYDNFRLVIGYSIPITEKIADYEALGTEMKLLIDNKTVTSMHAQSTVKDDVVLGTIETNVSLPDSFTLDINFSEVFNKKGNWSFRLPVTKNTQALVYEVNKKKEVDEYKFEVFDIQLTPSGTKIHLELDTPIGEDKVYDFLVYNHNGEVLEFIEENKKNIPLVNFDKEVVKTKAVYEPTEEKRLIIVPVLQDNGNVIEMEELAINVDLSTIKGKEVTSESTDYGLIEDKVDLETFLRNYMVEEVGNELGIELGEYTKADLSVLSLHFASDFQKQEKINQKHVVKPTALVEERTDANAYIIYKSEDGINHVFKAKKLSGEWEIVDSFTTKGQTILEVENIYENQ